MLPHAEAPGGSFPPGAAGNKPKARNITERSRVPIFETGIQQSTSSVGTVASIIWQPSNSSATTYGALGSVPTGSKLVDVVIANTGSNTMYVGFGSLSAASTSGFEIKAGGELVYYGYNVTSSGAATGNIWGQTGVVGQTTSCTVGLASIQNAVV